MTLLKAEICCPLLHGCFIIPDVYFLLRAFINFRTLLEVTCGVLSLCFLGDVVILFQMTVQWRRQTVASHLDGATEWRCDMMAVEPTEGSYICAHYKADDVKKQQRTRTHTPTLWQRNASAQALCALHISCITDVPC